MLTATQEIRKIIQLREREGGGEKERGERREVESESNQTKVNFLNTSMTV